MRVGIYPGAFDPIHEGHLSFARAARQQFKLDKVFFLVEPRPRRKQGVRALEHRIAMTQASIADDDTMGVIMLEEARFAIDSTWPKVAARLGDAELYMLMGEETLDHIASWPQIEELLDIVPDFIIGVKSSEAKQDIQERLYALQYTKAFPFVYHLIEQPLPKIRSSVLRTTIKKGGTSKNVAVETARYITDNKLYLSPLS